MANEFVARKGLIAKSDSIISGSLTVTAPITGSGAGLTNIPSSGLQAPGSDTQILFNSDGSLAANSGLVYSGSNVGIGTITPTALLHVSSSSTEISRLDSGNTSGGYLTFANSDTVRGFVGFGGTLFTGLDNANFGVRSQGGLALATNGGSTRMYIDTAGNVGIGTTNPGQRLEVTGNTYVTGYVQASSALIGNKVISSVNYATFGSNSASTGVALSRDWNPGTYPDLIINPSGNVGIGTTTPTAKLTVEGSGSTILDIQGSQGQLFSVTDSLVGSLFSVNDISGLPIIEVFDTDKVVMGTFGQNTLVVTGSNVGIGTDAPNRPLTIETNTTDVTGALKIKNTGSGDASMFFQVNGAGIVWQLGIDNSDGDKFKIGQDNSLADVGVGTKLTIDTSGNVGIGTTDPAGRLDVRESTTGDLLARVWNTNTSGTGDSILRIANSGNNANGNRIEFSDQNYYTATISGDRSQGIVFRTSATGSSATGIPERVRITSTGNVGIGTPSPSDLLDVSGQITQIGSGDYHYASGTARFSEGGVQMSRSSAGYIGVYPHKNIDTFVASVSFKTTNSTHLGIAFRASETAPDDNNYAVIIRNNSPTDSEVRVQKRLSSTQTYPISAVNVTTDCDDGEWHTLNVAFNGSHIIVYIDDTKYIDEAWTDTSFTNPGRVGTMIYDGTVSFANFDVTETKALLTELDDRYVNVTGDTMTGALTITDPGTGLLVDSAGHASLRMDRGSTSFDSNLLYYTAGVLKWRIWMDGSDDYLYIRDEVNSSNMVTFKKGGNVGIGTDNPSDKLDIHGIIALNSVAFISQSGNTGYIGDIDGTDAISNLDINTADGATRIFLDDGGNVGIGTTSPENRLHLGPNGGNVKLALEWSDSHSATSGEAYSTIYTSGQGGSYPFSGRGNLILQPRNTDSDGAGDLVIMTGATAVPRLIIQATGNTIIKQDLTVQGIVTAQEFHTEFVSASIIYQSGSTQFGDTSDDIHEFTGKVGINTGTPETALHVIGDIGAGTAYNGGYYASSDSSNVDQNWGFTFSKTSGTDDYATRMQFYPVANSARKLGFYDSRNSTWMAYFDGGVNSNPNFIFSTGGNVGIGTNSPANKLTVNDTLTNGLKYPVQVANITGGDGAGTSAGILFNVGYGGTSRGKGALVYNSNGTGYNKGDFMFLQSSVADTSQPVLTDAVVTIKNNGNVGIGTTSPSALLHVSSSTGRELKVIGGTQGHSLEIVDRTGYTTTTPNIYIQDADNLAARATLQIKGNDGAIESMFVASNGYTGLGTATPSDKLHVVGNARFGGGASDQHIKIMYGSGTSDYGAVRFYSNGTNTNTVHSFPTAWQSNNPLASGGSVNITGVTATTIGDWNDPDAVIRNDGATYFKNDVGIGITNPDTKLHLYEAAAAPTLLTLHNYQADIISNGTQGNFIDFKMTDGNATFTPQARIGMIIQDTDGDTGINSEGAGNFVIYTGDGTNSVGSGSLVEHVRVTHKGRVGFGTAFPDRDVHLEKTVSGGQVRLQVENNSNTANSHGVISIYAGGDSSGDPFIHWKTGNAGQDWSAGIDNSSSDRFAISKNFGPGVNDYFTINTNGIAIAPMTFEAGGKRVYNNVVSDSGAGIANGVTASLDADGNTTLSVQYQYKFTLTTQGTGTYSGAMYILHYNGSNWITRGVSRSGTSSNHPEMTTAGEAAIIYDDHATGYNVHYRVESYYRGNNNTALHSFGGDYHWQRTGGTLHYADGYVGIGVENPSSHLQVAANTTNSSIRAGGLEMQSYAINNAWYAENLYHDGSNWRLRSAGYATQMYMQDGAIEFKRAATAAAGTAVSPISTMKLVNNGNVGIGTPAPTQKLDVNGNIRATGSIFDAQTFNTVDSTFNSTNTTINSTNIVVGNNTTDNVYIGGSTVYVRDSKVGIGTTSPAYKLEVRDGNIVVSGSTSKVALGTATGVPRMNSNSNNDLLFSTATQTNVLYLQESNGRVGIGTTSPTKALTVEGAVSASGGFYGSGANLTGITTSDGLANILENSNSADSFSINMNTNDITGVGEIQADIFNGLSASLAYVTASAGLLVDTELTVQGAISSSGDIYVGPANTGGTIWFKRLTGQTARITAGSEMDIYTDNLVRFIESDNNTVRLVAGLNSGTFNINTTGEYNAAIKLYVNGDSRLNGDLTVTGNANVTASWATNLVNLPDLATVLTTGNGGGGLSITEVNDITAAGTVEAGSFVETSARRFKENIEPITGALDTIIQLEGVTFNRIGEQKREYGFIADEVESIAPELTSHDDTGQVHGVHYARTVAVLTEAVKELDNKVKAQDLFIKDLVARIEKLENK